uniref:Mediator of RNA polymerase II transcription subunit 17 n=1 Tax=Kalanchoe fedtschenkoi TaxID=63787 RepID=A0A7N0VI74_KALFE
MEISLDKLPIKRLDAIEENGFERFPTDVGYEEKRVSLIRRIDFAWAVQEKDDEADNKNKKKKQKSSKDSSSSSTPSPWQTLVENLQLAHQELTVIIDLINTVEANDAVTVASMARPKPLPNELLSDLSVSVATKLQCYKHLGKYFRQSAKALELQIGREARFYGALIRLQQNWKVKRQRLAAPGPGSDGFTFDLYDNSSYDQMAVLRPVISTVPVDRDSAGMLDVHLPPKSCRSLHFCLSGIPLQTESDCTISPFQKHTTKGTLNDDVVVKETHALLREVHRAIFDEQVFDLVNREAYEPSPGVNVTGIRENFLQLNIGQGASVYLSLTLKAGENQHAEESDEVEKLLTTDMPVDTEDTAKLMAQNGDAYKYKEAYLNQRSYHIYMQQLFHDHAFVRNKDKTITSDKSHATGSQSKDGCGLLGHFCISLAHRIFSNKVLAELENLVCRVPYLQLITHPTWHSRTSSWTLSLNVPRSNVQTGHQMSGSKHLQNAFKSQFRTRIIVNDDCITIEGEGAPSVVGLFRGSSDRVCFTNKYECDLGDLALILLQQVASQVIRWLHEEAQMVGIKSNQDFLCLSLELDQGETIGLVAHIDPRDSDGCISWWLIMEDAFSEEPKIGGGEPSYRKFLGYLSLGVLRSTLMDLVSLCNEAFSK